MLNKPTFFQVLNPRKQSWKGLLRLWIGPAEGSIIQLPVAAFREAVTEAVQALSKLSMSGAAGLSWGNGGRPVGYGWEGICGKGGKVTKGRVVALQLSCMRENVLRNVRKRLVAMKHTWKTWKSSHFDFSSLSDGQSFFDPIFDAKIILLNIKESQYINCSSLCSHKILKTRKLLLSLILRAYEHKDK